MIQQELLKQLMVRKEELVKELDAINALINFYSDSLDNKQSPNKAEHSHSFKLRKGTTSDVIIPKEKKGWKSYTLEILTYLKEAKTSDIVEIVRISNPELPKSVIRTAIAGQLSILFKEGIIDADNSVSKNAGYRYKIKKEPEGS